MHVAELYLAAANAHDIDAMIELWEPGGLETFPTFQQSYRVPIELAENFRSLFDAFPDLRWTILSITQQDEQVVVRSRMQGTHLGLYQGIEATRKTIDVDTIDLLLIRGGKIIQNDVIFDGLTVLRQIGALPPAGSRRERLLQRGFNALTSVRRRTNRGVQS